MQAFTVKMVMKTDGCLISVSTQPYTLVTKHQRYPETGKPSCALTVGSSSALTITWLVEMLIKSSRTGRLNFLAHELIVATKKSW